MHIRLHVRNLDSLIVMIYVIRVTAHDIKASGVRVAARGDNDGDEDASASAALAAAAADVEDVTLHVATRCSSQ